MSTQPLEKESSLRKPSSIGEEIRKELEKRGLRAPKADPIKTNGKEVDTSVEAPIQIAVVEDSQEDIDIEVKPIDQVDESELIEEGEAVSTQAEVEEEEELVQESDVEPFVMDQDPSEESDQDVGLDEPEVVQELIDTKEPDTEGDPEEYEIEVRLAGEETTDPILLSPPDDVHAIPKAISSPGDIVEGPNFIILPHEEPMETFVDVGPLDDMQKEESAPTQPLRQDEEIEVGAVSEVEWEERAPNDLPDTAELDEGTLEVLKSYTKARSSAGFSVGGSVRSEVVDSILSVASHELRSPLQAISGFLELLVNSDAADSRQEEQFLSIAYRESTHLGDIIADLETASLIESGKFKLHVASFSMEHLIQNCIEKYNQPEWQGEIFLEDARLKDLPDLEGDELYLRQALNNLISAVLRPLHLSHHVFIRTFVDDFDLIIQLVSAVENPSDQTLPDMRAAKGEFNDISQEGLGIFVARHIIEAHGGVLVTQGTELEGHTYTLQLPLKPRTESRGIVLITEDNTHAALLMEYALERDGYIPIKARNGLEALEIVANDEVDMVILDVVLPGMDGFEVCYRMRSSPETASIPVVIVSAKSGDEYRAKALRVGADAYFRKPLVLADLLITMEKLLENGDEKVSQEEVEVEEPKE